MTAANFLLAVLFGTLFVLAVADPSLWRFM